MTDVRDESRNFLRVIMIYGTISLGLIMINRIVMQNNFNLRLLQRSFCFAVLINYFDSGRNFNQKCFFLYVPLVSAPVHVRAAAV